MTITLTDIRNYLLKAVQNTAFNWYKKNSRVQQMEQEDALFGRKTDIRNDVLVDYICQKMEYKKVLSAIEGLEQKYFDVIYYHLVLEIPVPKVADLLG